MLYVEPDIYGEFKCIASACKHSCCKGWEIDIDEDTVQLYSQIQGTLGNELKQNIEMEPQPHFRLDEDKRCPFLENSGLCRVILGLGEEALCDICREHPRFYNSFDEREEAGLGLCCEEVVRLLISGRGPLRLIAWGEKETELPFGPGLRDELFSLLSQGGSMEERIKSCCRVLKVERPSFDMSFWKAFLLDLERMDGAWDRELMRIAEPVRPLPEDIRYTRVLQYLLYRHLSRVEDIEQGRQVFLFCLLSLELIAAMEHSGGTVEDILRLFSSEIEYSDENIDKILAAL